MTKKRNPLHYVVAGDYAKFLQFKEKYSHENVRFWNLTSLSQLRPVPGTLIHLASGHFRSPVYTQRLFQKAFDAGAKVVDHELSQIYNYESIDYKMEPEGDECRQKKSL